MQRWKWRIVGDTLMCSSKTAHLHMHRAHNTWNSPALELVQQETPKFISPDLWLPHKPDPNAVDYKIWGLMQERVYKTPIGYTSQAVEAASHWHWDLVNHIIRHHLWRYWSIEKRMWACMKAKRRQFKHMLYTKPTLFRATTLYNLIQSHQQFQLLPIAF